MCGDVGSDSRPSGKRKRSSCSIVKPASSIAAAVSRPAWQPPPSRPDGGIERPLYACEARSLGADVFEEAHLATGSEHPMRLTERDRLIADRTQHQRQHDGVSARVGRRQPLSHPVHDVDVNGGSDGVPTRDAAEVRLRLDGEHAGHLRWVVREVETVARAHLDDLPGQACEQPPAVVAHPSGIHPRAHTSPEAGEDRVADGCGLHRRSS